MCVLNEALACVMYTHKCSYLLHIGCVLCMRKDKLSQRIFPLNIETQSAQAKVRGQKRHEPAGLTLAYTSLGDMPTDAATSLAAPSLCVITCVCVCVCMRVCVCVWVRTSACAWVHVNINMPTTASFANMHMSKMNPTCA